MVGVGIIVPAGIKYREGIEEWDFA